jgi:ketosteroid isomerase-like protein
MSQSQVITDTNGLAERYRAAVEAGDVDALAELYRSAVLLDAHVPNWRFQVQGRDAVAETTGTGLPGPGRFASFDAEPTVAGDLLVRCEWHQEEERGGQVVRELHLWRLDDVGRITEQVVFCSGVWDRQLQARMAAEAPLIRP